MLFWQKSVAKKYSIWYGFRALARITLNLTSETSAKVLFTETLRFSYCSHLCIQRNQETTFSVLVQTIFFATLRWITISRTRSWCSSDPLCSLYDLKHESKKVGSLRIRFLHYSALSFGRRVIGLKISSSLFAFFANLHYIG